MSDVIVCRPDSVTGRRVRECPTCKTRRRFVVQSFVWYDSIWTCCTCGDEWSAGERLARPFHRGWRAERSAVARRKWATALNRHDERKAVERMIRAELDGWD